MAKQSTAAALRREFRSIDGGRGASDGVVTVRALDRLSDAQLAAAEVIAWQGLGVDRVAQRLNLDVAQIRRWFRDPVFIAGVNELSRAIAAGQLVPMALARVRGLLCDPRLTLRDAVSAGRFVAELAGLQRNSGAPEAGFYAPGPLVSGRSIGEMSAAELARVAAAGQSALARLSAENSAEALNNPLE